jgi:hypothetical protein
MKHIFIRIISVAIGFAVGVGASFLAGRTGVT